MVISLICRDYSKGTKIKIPTSSPYAAWELSEAGDPSSAWVEPDYYVKSMDQFTFNESSGIESFRSKEAKVISGLKASYKIFSVGEKIPKA